MTLKEPQLLGWEGEPWQNKCPQEVTLMIYCISFRSSLVQQVYWQHEYLEVGTCLCYPSLYL